MAKKSKVPTPREDPRYSGSEGEMRRSNAQRGPSGYQEYQGSLTNVRDHPSDTGHQATEHYDRHIKDVYDALGPKTTYQMETRQMGQAVDISENVPRKEE